MSNSCFVVARCPSLSGAEALRVNVIDNGDGTRSLYVVEEAQPTYPSIVTATGAPVVAGAGTGSVSGSGTTGKLPKWTNGAASILADSVISESGGNISIGGALLVPSLTANAFLFSGVGGQLTSTAAPTDGQLLIGSTGAAPVRAALTAGSGVTITNAAGSITIAASGSGGTVTGTGTTGTLPKWSNGAGGVLANSVITESGGNISIGGALFVPSLTANAFLFSGVGGQLTSTAAPTDGQLLIGSTGAAPVRAALTAGSGVTITNAAGAITIAASGSGGTVTGTGTTGALPKWSNGAGGVLADSVITESGGAISVGGALFIPSLANNAFVFSAVGGQLKATASATDGQLLIGSTGGEPQLGALTAGSGITITNAAGSITIAASGGATPVTTWFIPNANIYAGGAALSTAGVFLGANEVQCWQFVLTDQITINHLTFEVVVADVTNHLGVAIYSANGNSKLVDTGAVLATGGFQNVAIGAVVLPAGVYWLAWTHDANVATIRAVGAVGYFGAWFNGGQNTKVGTAANSGAAGVCPSSLGAVTPQTALSQILVLLET